MAEELTPEQRHRELVEETSAAIAKYFKPTESIAPNMCAFILNADIKLQPWHATMHKGVFFVTAEDAKRLTEDSNISRLYLYALSFDEMNLGFNNSEEELEKAIQEGKAERVTLEDGTTRIAYKDEMKMSLKVYAEQLKVPNREEPLSLAEAAIWGAIQDAEEAGDMDKAQRLYEEGYSPVKITADPTPQVEEILPKQDINPVITHVQGISKVSNTITELNNGEDTHLKVGGKNEGSVQTFIKLNYDSDNMSLSKPISPYDREIHDAVATLWAAGNKTFTSAQVYRAMRGGNSALNPKRAALEKIEESLDKQRRTFVTLDFSQEARGRKLEFEGSPVTNLKRETYMLEADKVTIETAGGNKVEGYKISAEPILYWHDMTTKQIVSYPQALLAATSKVASNTDRNILIRSYLLRRIKSMSGSANSRQITYESILKNIGEAGANRKTQGVIRESVRKFLTAFKDEGFITGWSEYQTSNASHNKIAGVSIKL